MATVALARHAMATRFEIVLHGPNAVSLRGAGEEALDEIDRLERQLSIYLPGSEVSALNRQADKIPVRVEPRLFALLREAIRLSELSEGAFDITAGPLIKAWGFMAGTGALPEKEALKKAMERVGYQHLLLNEENFTVSFARPGMMIDLGAIGKGYAIDRALELLVEAGIQSALLHGGTSTIYGLGSQENGKPWLVSLPPHSAPDETWPREIELRNQALSVSAIWGKSFEQDNQTLGHVIDPASGLPVQAARSAAVRCVSATASDALSTAALVQASKGLPWISQKYPDVSAWVLR